MQPATIGTSLPMCQRFSVLRASSRAASKPGPVTCSARVSNGEAAGVSGRRAMLAASGEEGRECRLQALKDESKLDYRKEQNVGKSKQLVASSQNGAQSINQDKYFSDTEELAKLVEAFLAADVYDPKRSALIDKIKLEGNKWSGTYAPGGSSKRESGRDFYNCLNQLQGWFAFNGIAPLNKSTLEKVTRNLADTRALLAKDR